MINWPTIMYGGLFGLLDAIALPIIKGVSRGLNFKWMAIPFILYALSPFIFLKALASETLTIMNLVWDMSSDIIVTLIGLLFFRETISPVKKVGVILSFISLFLITYEGDGWNELISSNYKRVVSAFTL